MEAKSHKEIIRQKEAAEKVLHDQKLEIEASLSQRLSVVEQRENDLNKQREEHLEKEREYAKRYSALREFLLQGATP